MSTMISEKMYNMLYSDKYGSGEIKTNNIDTGAIATSRKGAYNSMW